MPAPSSILSNHLRNFNQQLRKNEISIFLDTDQLLSFNEAMATLGSEICDPFDLEDLHVTTAGVSETHGIVVDRGQLPLPPSDTHIRIDLIRTKTHTYKRYVYDSKERKKTKPPEKSSYNKARNFHPSAYPISPSYLRHRRGKLRKFTSKSTTSIGRLRMVLTHHGYHELHIHLDKKEHSRGYGVLLYLLASLQAHLLGIDLFSSTHPSVAAHRIYYSSRFRQACQVFHHDTRYEVLLSTKAINAIDDLIPELQVWDKNHSQFDYEKALEPHKKASTHMYSLYSSFYPDGKKKPKRFSQSSKLRKSADKSKDKSDEKGKIIEVEQDFRQSDMDFFLNY